MPGQRKGTFRGRAWRSLEALLPMDLFDMLWLWAHMQSGHLETDMESMSTLDTSVAALFVVLMAAYCGSLCCSLSSDCCSSSSIAASSISASATNIIPHQPIRKRSRNWSRSSGNQNSNDDPGVMLNVPRQSTYWENMLQRQGTWNADERVTDSHWQAQYRMSYRAFQSLTAEISPFIDRSNTNSATREDPPLALDKAVAMVLHRLAFGLSPSVVANLYNVGPSTVTKYTMQITDILSSRDKLYSKFVSTPSGPKLASTIAKFQDMTDIPNICGVIDGTHIKLRRNPAAQDMPKLYLNKYKFHSVLLQGVCDADKVFWDLCCNGPGGLHDELHFRSSSLWQKLKHRQILDQPIALVQGTMIQPFIVGDEEYQLSPFVITPFRASEIPPSGLQKNFDDALLRAHSCVESAFGLLKKRWGILANMNISLQYVPQVVVACCVLHNFCQLLGEKEPEDHVDVHLNNHHSNSPFLPHQFDTGSEAAEIVMAGRAYRAALFTEWVEKWGSRCNGYQIGNDGMHLAPS